MSTTSETPEFAAPGPGGWMRLADHFPGAVTAEYRRLYDETAPAGMAAYMARYGVVAKGIDVGYVHGHLYIAPLPLAGPRGMTRTPPRAAVWLMARLHPAFRRRARAARGALSARPWRSTATEWFASERVRWVERHRKVEAVDPTTLDTEALLAHLQQCRGLVVEGYRRHFELHGDDMLPVGLLLARCAEWGISSDVASRALDATSPTPVDTPAPAWQLLTGYDLDSLARAELPAPPSPRSMPVRGALDLRTLVAREHHGELEQLVADASEAERLRDDNGALIGAWPMGLLRRAMLECGRRLELDDATLAVEATVDELVTRLRGGSQPSAGTIEERRRARRQQSALDAPRTLGPALAVPPLDALPRALALIGAAQLASADHMAGDGRPVGIGETAHTGRALVVDDPGHALELVQPGDVVVTGHTCPSWNAVLADAGAIVTTTGGVLSHAAILARELGIPAVLGDRTAMARLVTGMTVTVDPAARTVTATLATGSTA